MNGFSKNLKRLRKERGLTLEEMSKQINKKYNISFNKSMISKWENGYEATLSSIRYLTLFFDVSVNELLGFHDVEETPIENIEDYKIPIYEEISPTYPYYRDKNIIDYSFKPPFIMVSKKGLDKLYLLMIKDESMDREFPFNSLVLVNKDEIIKDGDYAVAVIKDGNNKNEVIVRKVKIANNSTMLMPESNNDDYLPMIYDNSKEDITFLGKIIASYKNDY